VRVRGLGARDENEAVPGGGFGVGPGLLDLRKRNGSGGDGDVGGGDSLGQGAKLGDVLAGADRALALPTICSRAWRSAAEGIAAVGWRGCADAERLGAWPVVIDVTNDDSVAAALKSIERR
jgi:hypothetical protein